MEVRVQPDCQDHLQLSPPAIARRTFLQLPSEIRIQVYRHLFEAAQLSLESEISATLHCGLPICACAFPYQIVNVCQQLRHEAAPFLFASTTLQVCSTLDKVVQLPSTYVSAIRRVVVLNTALCSKNPMHLDGFSALTTLEFRNITIWCKYHDRAYLESSEGDDCMIGLALFNLGRISANLTRLCANENRSYKILLYCHYVVSSLTDETIRAIIDIDESAVLHKSNGPRIRDRNAWAGFY